MAVREICDHESREPKVLSDDSVVYDCRDCGEPLVEVQGRWVTVSESAKPSPRDRGYEYAAGVAIPGVPVALIAEAFTSGYDAALREA